MKRALLCLAIMASVAGCVDDGQDGVNGQAGLDGINGIDGANGANGSDGKSYPVHLNIEVVGRFASGTYGKSAAEIVKFHEASNSVFAINGAENQIEVINLSGLNDQMVATPVSDESLSSVAFNIESSVTVADNSGEPQSVELGDVNSLAISGDLLAVAVAASNKQNAGVVQFYQLTADGAGTYMHSVLVGALPDMLTFTPDGKLVLVANEGEPSKDYMNDPEGSISIIEIVESTPAMSASHINFSTDLVFSNKLLSPEDYDTESERKALLESDQVKFSSPEGTTVAQDLEPEYVAVSADSKKAFVSLQENNALAIVDLEAMSVEVKGLGYKDWSQHRLDYTNKDEQANLQQVNSLYGMYQPDTIATFSWNGATYVATANEGDAREYIYSTDETSCVNAGHEYDDGDCISFNEEVRIKDLTDSMTPELNNIYDAHGGKNGLGRLKVTNEMGMVDIDDDGTKDNYEKLYAYGARSFSLWDQSGNLIFDSGSDFEEISASVLGENFNSAHTENKGDNRSDDKGGEPEALAIGEIDGRTYAFIGLERSGDLFAYDVTNPFNVSFSAYYNNRDFNIDFELDDDLANPCDETEGMDCSQINLAGDLGPESIEFVHASNSPNGKPLLIIGNEVSGTVTVYQISED